jgi:hypothetical protein
MKRTSELACLIVVLAGLTVAGCSKEVTIHIDNATSTDLEARLEPEGVLPDRSVIVPADLAASPRIKVEIESEDLPMTFTVTAGDFEPMRFSIHEDTPGKLWIHITPNGILQPVGKGASIHVKHEYEEKDKPVRTEPVIE